MAACISVDGCRENLSGALASAHYFDLPNPVSKESMAMIHIRPHQIFSMGDNFDEPYQAFLPPNYSGSLLALETMFVVHLRGFKIPGRANGVFFNDRQE